MTISFLQKNSVAVYTDKPFYRPGDAVHGYVLLNCVQAFDCKQVLFKVEGYEKVAWEEKRSETTYNNDNDESTTEDRYYPYTAHKDFFKVSVQLQQFPQRCEPGQYQYNFAFALPHNLPGTFAYEDTQHFYGGVYYNYTKAKIKYKVKAECVVPGILKPNVRGKAYLTVHQLLSKLPSEVKATNTQSVTSCCCSNAGTCTVSASVQKDSYCPGETACVLLEVENNSTAEFSAVNLVLKRSVVLSGGGAVQRLEDDAAKISTGAVGPNTSFTGKDARLLQLPLPTNLLPSAVGEVIQCEYQLVVTLKAHTFVSNAELKVPVLIYMPQSNEPVYPKPPSWWTATQVLPPIQVELPSAPPLPPPAQEMYVPPQPTYQHQP